MTPALPSVETAPFVLGSSLAPEALSRAIDEHRLIRHAELGGETVYRNMDAVAPDFIVEDIYPTALALAGSAGLDTTTDYPPFIFADATALYIAGYGVLLPPELEVLCSTEFVANPDVPGVAVLDTTPPTRNDWHWIHGMPVMAPLQALERLASDPGVEPQWLATAAADILDEEAATFAEVASAVDSMSKAWGYASGAQFLNEGRPAH